MHAVQAPALSQVEQPADFPEAQHMVWQSAAAHSELAEQAWPADFLQSPEATL